MRSKLHVAFLASLGIFLCFNAMAQNAPDWASVIQEIRGDTVVVKSYSNTRYINTIQTAVLGDTTASGMRVNVNRVYETVPGEYYVSDCSLDLDATVANLVLTAPTPSDNTMPPIHIRTRQANGILDRTFIQSTGDIYIENQYYCGAFIDDSYESEFNRAVSGGARVIINNCIFDLTRWVICIPLAKHVTYKFTNCTFINIGHEPSLEKGYVIETRTLPPDTLWFENNTCINSGGFITSLHNSAPSFAYFNHNTIVNCAQGPFMFHSAGEVIVENNLIVNAAIVPDYPGFYPYFDDDDHMPKGIINVDTVKSEWKDSYWDGIYPFAEADRKILFDRNSIYWDGRFDDMVKTKMTPIPDSIVPGGKWTSQMIVMNDRTKAMFDDDAAYPYFYEGLTYNQEPDFVTLADKVPEWIDWVVSNADPVRPNYGDYMPSWRTHDVRELHKIDWPMLADLSYSNAALKRGGLNGFPLGDLNWFPTEKATWETLNESDALIESLKSGAGNNFSSPGFVYKGSAENGVTVSWGSVYSPNLAGYKIYYDPIDNGGYNYSIDVGLDTLYTISGISINDTIAVTAYDDEADGDDDFTEGHESWFSKPAQQYYTSKIITGNSSCFGEEIHYQIKANGGISADNSFIIQLSDTVGSFKNPIDLIKVDTSKSVLIKLILPSFMLTEKDYKLRVKSTNPSIYSGVDSIILHKTPTPTFVATSFGCYDSVANIKYVGTANDTASFNWNFDLGSILSGSGAGPFEIKWSNTGLKTISLIVDEMGCSSDTSIDVLINSPTLPIPICMVGVDSSNYNMIVWEQAATNLYDSILIYKETSQADVYEKIGSQSADNASVFIDKNANPVKNSSKYKLAVIDTCGYESLKSTFHKTMHLTINSGVGGALILVWDGYEGFTYSTYNIYRGTSVNNLLKIAEQASNTFTYTDMVPPVGIVYYQIEIEKPTACMVSNLKSTNNYYGSIRSNIVNSIQVNIDSELSLQNITIYPNPADNKLYIQSTKSNSDFTIQILSLDGKCLFNTKKMDLNTEIDISELNSGLYLIRLISGKQSINTKFIKR